MELFVEIVESVLGNAVEFPPDDGQGLRADVQVPAAEGATPSVLASFVVARGVFVGIKNVLAESRALGSTGDEAADVVESELRDEAVVVSV